MSKKKICITIDWYLPGTNSGGPVRSIANLVEALTEIDYYIITRNTDYCSVEPYQEIKANSWIQRSSNESVYYFSRDSLFKSNLKKVIFELNPDCLYINGIYSKAFSIWPLQIGRKLEIKTIVASRGMLSPHALNIKAIKKKLFLTIVNFRSFYEEIFFHATQEDEKSHIQEVIKKYRSIEVIPNFPRQLEEVKIRSIIKNSGEVKFIALGRISEEKGTLISIEALKEVKGKVSLDLYGTIYDNTYWEKCLNMINDLPSGVQVHYKGSLNSDEVLKTIMDYHFLLLPSKGENYGHSIAEAFFARRPVIISKNTPWKNLESMGIGYDIYESQLRMVLQSVIDMEDSEYQSMINNLVKETKVLINNDNLIERYYNFFNRINEKS